MIIENQCNPVTIDIPEHVKTVLIKMSGGADSSLLAYLLALYKKENRPDIKYYVMTVNNRQKFYQSEKAKQVMSFITEQSGVTFEDHFVSECDSDIDYEDAIESLQIQVLSQIKYDASFQGITMNPNTPDFSPLKNDANPERDAKAKLQKEVYHYVNPTRIHYWPFINVNKKGLAEIYQKYNLIDTLFPITRSCEGVIGATHWPHTKPPTLDKHCGECWWCAERLWGFGRLQ